MSDKPDIVERLRKQVSPLKRENLPGSADLCIEAADQIKRLRDERDEYKEAFEFAHKEFHETLDDLAKMKDERDEARRMVCRSQFTMTELQHDYAKDKGWDCFKNLLENT